MECGECEIHKKTCSKSIDKENNQITSCVLKNKHCKNRECADLNEQECLNQYFLINGNYCQYQKDKNICRPRVCEDINTEITCDHYTFNSMNG